jgi:hypothetical protein
MSTKEDHSEINRRILALFNSPSDSYLLVLDATDPELRERLLIYNRLARKTGLKINRRDELAGLLRGLIRRRGIINKHPDTDVLIAEFLSHTGTLGDQSKWWIGEVIVPLMAELADGADLCDVAVRQIAIAMFHNTAYMAMSDRAAALTGQVAPPETRTNH